MSKSNPNAGGSKGSASKQPASRARGQQEDQALEGGMAGMAIGDNAPAAAPVEAAPVRRLKPKAEVPPMDYWIKKNLPKFPKHGPPDPLQSKREDDSIVTGNKPAWHPHPVRKQEQLNRPPGGLKIQHFADSTWPGVTWNAGTFNSKKGKPIQIVVRSVNQQECTEFYSQWIGNERVVLKTLKHKYILDRISEFNGFKHGVPVSLISFPRCDPDLESKVYKDGPFEESAIKVMMGQVAQALE